MCARRRLILPAALVAACVALAVGYVGFSVARSPGSERTHIVDEATLGPGADPIRTTHASSVDSGDLLFVSMIPDRTSGSLAVAPLSDLEGARAIADLKCERASYAGGRGICLVRGGGEDVESELEIFDSAFHVRRRIAVEGAPSRARVSPGGRYGAITMFEPGEEDSGEGPATETRIIDLASGKDAVDLEKLPLTKDGRRFSKDGLHVASVTFADDDRFYASLGTGTSGYLIEGSLRAGSLKVIAKDADSPSLSPDGRRIALRRLAGGAGRLYVLDLRTMKATRLAGNDPIDDQAEWLDGERLVYANDNKLWEVRADGSGGPRQILSFAYSPTVIPER